jgi:hypothetical protein
VILNRAIKEALGTYFFPRVQLDLSKDTWSKIFDNAFGEKLHPSFDPYANSLNYLISTYTIPYVGLTGYVGAAPLLTGEGAKAVCLLTLAPIFFPLSQTLLITLYTASIFWLLQFNSQINSMQSETHFFPSQTPSSKQYK